MINKIIMQEKDKSNHCNLNANKAGNICFT